MRSEGTDFLCMLLLSKQDSLCVRAEMLRSKGEKANDPGVYVLYDFYRLFMDFLVFLGGALEFFCVIWCGFVRFFSPFY